MGTWIGSPTVATSTFTERSAVLASAVRCILARRLSRNSEARRQSFERLRSGLRAGEARETSQHNRERGYWMLVVRLDVVFWRPKKKGPWDRTWFVSEGCWIVLGSELTPSTSTLVSFPHSFISKCSFRSEPLCVGCFCALQLFCAPSFCCFSRAQHYLRWERILQDPLPHSIQICLNRRPNYHLVTPTLAFGMENSRHLVRKAPKLDVVCLVIHRLCIRVVYPQGKIVCWNANKKLYRRWLLKQRLRKSLIVGRQAA